MTNVAPPRQVLRGSRLDWRFLLPTCAEPLAHLVLLGAPASLAARVLEAGLAQRVSVALPEAGTADAVAAFSLARVAVRDLAECLRPGGVLYSEVDRRTGGQWRLTPRRARAQLRAAGLVPTGTYWAAPNFDACRRYVPLDGPEAMRWYLSALFVSGSPGHRLLAGALRLGLGAGVLPALVPCFALTATTALPPAASAAWWTAGVARPLVLTSGHDSGSRTVLLPFQRGDRRPRTVVKIAAHAALNANTAGEQATLATLHGRLGGALQRTVPRPLGEALAGGLRASLESSAPGQSLVASSGAWPASFHRQVADLQLMARWLSGFHAQVGAPAGVWDAALFARWLAEPLEAYAATFGLTPAEAALFDQTRAQGQALLGKPLPLVWLHYDFAPWNLFRHGQTLTVIDWETGRGAEHRWGPGLYDLLYGVTYWHHVVRRLHTEAAELEGLAALFGGAAPGGRYVEAAHHVIRGYLAEQGVDVAFVPVMLVALWVEQALHRVKRGQALGAAPAAQPAARAASRPVRYLGVLAEQRAALRATWDVNHAGA